MRTEGPGARLTFVFLAFCCGFAAVAGGLFITQPAAAGATVTVQFEVRPSDNSAAVAAHLKQAGLIRSTLVFEGLARARQLDVHLRPGTYQLSPAMTMDAIIHRLLTGEPDLPFVPPGMVLIIIPPGLRVTQYPPLFASLSHFSAAGFLKIAGSGTLPNGKTLASAYWFVPPKRSGVYYALEGYLLPGTYILDGSDDEVAAIDQLLAAFGEQLCPGPDATHADAYMRDQAQCKAHAALVGPKHTNIFTEMEQRYFTTNDVTALYDAVIVGSLVVRVSSFAADAAGTADVYYNRYLAAHNNNFDPAGDYVQNLDSVATAEYARDSDSPPHDDSWWSPLGADASSIDPGSPYNTAVAGTTGLIPGPIAAPTWTDIVAAATADEPTASPNYFVVADRCGHAHYARSLADFLYTSQEAIAGCYND